MSKRRARASTREDPQLDDSHGSKAPQGGTLPISGPDTQFAFDVPEMTRGVSTGFSVLLVGSAARPLATLVNTELGVLWLSMVAALAFVLAGRRTGMARRRRVQGALAALFSFTLTLPVVLGVQGTIAPYPTLVTAAFALIVGALAGALPKRSPRRPAKSAA
jgi:hypothetical protein